MQKITSKSSRRCGQSSISANQIAAKQHLRVHLKRIRQREYAKLRAMVPAVAQKKSVSKVTVIEEAVKYIDELHRALAERLRAKQGFENTGINEHNVKYLVQQMMAQQMAFQQNSSPSPVYQNQREFPSWVIRSQHGDCRRS